MSAGIHRLADLVAIRRAARDGSARALRVEAGIGCRELAAAMGTSPSNLSRWENGKAAPPAEVALRWYDLLAEIEAALTRYASGATP